MKWKKMLSCFLAAALAVPSGLASVGPLKARAEGMVTDEELQDQDAAAPDKDEVTPDANQYQYQKEELAAFCHFGMNTFTGSEWGNGQESPARFTLTDPFDADTYVKALKDAGFQKLIVTAKHHDGFCIWRSQYTEHDLEATNYQGDVLEEISAACTKYDMDMGLYLSPWDVNSPYYGYYDADGNALCDGSGQPLNGKTWDEVEELDVLDYNEYYNNQLIEILGNNKYGNNGTFTEVWMDGAKGEGSSAQNYDFTRWFDTIQKYEGKAAGRAADCMLFGAESYTTVRWIGNESGFANEETWAKSKINREANTIDSNNIGSYTKGYSDGNQWTVPEADARITSGWFWGASKSTPKTIEELAEMYFRSVGHNATLLLNVPPNNQGKVDEAILERVAEFGREVEKTFQTNYAADNQAVVSANAVRGNSRIFSPDNLTDGDDATYWTVDDGEQTGVVQIDLGRTRQIDVVSIEESIEFGQRITGFSVEYSNEGGAWESFDEGTTIGAKRLCRRTPVKADKVRVTITGTTGGVPMLSEVGVYKASSGFETASVIPESLVVVDNTDKDVSDGQGFTYTGWTQETFDNMIGGTGMWANPGAEFTLTFRGTKAWLFGTVDPNHGTADIYIDGSSQAETIDTYAASRKVNQVIYTTPDLDYGVHTLRLVTKDKATGIQAAAVLDNNGRGMFEIEEADYLVTEGVDDVVSITIRRLGGSSGEVKVDFQVNPGSAMQADFDADANQTLVFEDGETEKKVSVEIYRNGGDDERTLEDFTVEILSASGEENRADIGFTEKATVTIYEPQEAIAQELLDQIVEAKGINAAYYTTNTFAAMNGSLQRAKAAAADQSASNEQWTSALEELSRAMDELEPRSGYSEEDRLLLPAKEGDSALAEAEYFTLDASGAEEGKHVRVTEREDFSNGKGVTWFEAGNVISVPFTAKKAGRYAFVAVCESGAFESDPNKLNWSGTGITEGSVNVSGDASALMRISFEVEITQPGDGILYFTADEKKSPNIDCFEITALQLEVGIYQITASAGEHGSISDEGTTQVLENGEKTYTIIPDEGYKIADVLVNGSSVGAVDSYTFTGLKDDAEITAQFAFAYYTDGNPAVLKASGEHAIEAEHFELIQTPAVASKYVRLTENAQASNGQEVNWFEEGNQIRLPFVAEQAGTYRVTATYRSGRIEGTNNPNAFEWSGVNVSEGYLDVYGESGAVTFHQAEFEITVSQPGEGALIFTASSKAGPVIDKFTFQRQEDPPVSVAGVTISHKTALLDQIGATLQLGAAIVPENAANQRVSWNSSNESVAVVDESGLVTAVGSGKAVITVTTEDGEKTDQCEVTVEEERIDVPAAVSGVTLDRTEAVFSAIGQTLKLTAEVAPSNAGNKEVTWSSSNPSVAQVDQDGLVTAKGNGTAVITVTTRDGGKTSSCRITVQEAKEPVTAAKPAPGRATGVKVSNNKTNAVTVTWTKVQDAESYRVYLYTNKKWRSVGETEGNKLTIRKLKPGTKYSVKVEAWNKQGAGEASPAVKTATKPAKTGLKGKTAGTGKVKLTFKKKKASGYEIWFKAGNGKFKKLKTVKKASFTKSGLKAGRKYTFRVRAYVKNGSAKVYGAYSKKTMRL